MSAGPPTTLAPWGPCPRGALTPSALANIVISRQRLPSKDQFVALLSILTSQRDDFPNVSQFIKVVSPCLHHLDAFRPIFGCVHVSAPNIIRFLVCQVDAQWRPDSIDPFRSIGLMPFP